MSEVRKTRKPIEWLPMWIVCAAWLIIATAMTVAVVVAAASGQPALLLALILTVPLTWFCGKLTLRIPRAEVVVDGEGVRIVGPLRTWCVPVADAEKFVAGVRPGNNGQPGITLLRHSAPAISVWALNRNGLIWNFKRMVSSLEPIADELNTALGDARSMAITPAVTG